MLDAKRLLDQFLGGNAAGTGGGQSGSPLGELVRQIGGRSAGGGRPGGAAGGIGGMLGGLSNETLMGAGGLAAILLGAKGGRKLGGSALKMGGMAVIGSLAYKAYQDWQAGKLATAPATGGPATGGAAPILPAPSGTPFNPSTDAEQQSLSLKLMRAMIAAAKADGQVDAAEQARIFGQMDKLDLDQEAKAFVIDELRAPLDIEAVATSASTPEEAAEIYAASLLAVDVDSAAERGYLGLLAARLGLDEALVEHLRAKVDAATAKSTPSDATPGFQAEQR